MTKKTKVNKPTTEKKTLKTVPTEAEVLGKAEKDLTDTLSSKKAQETGKFINKPRRFGFIGPPPSEGANDPFFFWPEHLEEKRLEKKRLEEKKNLAETLSAQEKIGTLLPIETGKVKFYNNHEGRGFITPDDRTQKDVFIGKSQGPLNDGDVVSYVKLDNREAMLTKKGRVKLIDHKERLAIITPDEEGKDVVLKNNKMIKLLAEGDDVEYVTNTRGRTVVGIKKIEK